MSVILKGILVLALLAAVWYFSYELYVFLYWLLIIPSFITGAWFTKLWDSEKESRELRKFSHYLGEPQAQSTDENIKNGNGLGIGFIIYICFVWIINSHYSNLSKSKYMACCGQDSVLYKSSKNSNNSANAYQKPWERFQAETLE